MTFMTFHRLAVAAVVLNLAGISFGSGQYRFHRTRNECKKTYGLQIGSTLKTSHIYYAVNCQETSGCRSFLYNKKTRECHLNSATLNCYTGGCVEPLLYGGPVPSSGIKIMCSLTTNGLKK